MTWDQWNQPEPGDECEPPVEDGREEWLDGLQAEYGRINLVGRVSHSATDWMAMLDGYEVGDPLGTGATEDEAIHDLIEQLEDA